MSDALQRLIEAVEAPLDTHGILHAMPDGTSYHHVSLILSAFDGSLDAAKALHDALLPGWLGLFTLAGGARVTYFDGSTIKEHEGAVASNPARAWLIAILRAYQQVQLPDAIGSKDE